MADRSAKRLARLHRVRSLQLDLVRADEAKAVERVAGETALRDRIDQLHAAVAPAATPTPTDATHFIAAAHYRDRLQQSADTAKRRLAAAERGLDDARERTQAAWRDQSAVEKLMERAEEAAAAKARRTLEAMPATARPKRHDPC
ncbi:hypothetical protein [Stakelama saccharophila]|uniref:Flagellar FliJ protein n=1 Tax=Stakelama saccharophila TaxID=3075605 RepID=A0ABZ0B8W2_9SPHN|nr:hypothetical protein [Stakelama sp. W311]WNO53697.1 hypothetical protein RPR59_00040 [Stakelama sp. W311]